MIARKRCVSMFVVAAFAIGCAGAPSEGGAKPASTTRPPDVTEVTMEVTSADAGAAPEPGPTAAAASGATTPAPATSTDPSDDPMIGGPQDASMEKAVAPVRPRLRACYKKALAAAPSVGGSATFDATIGKDGRVSSVRFVKRDGLNEDMVGFLLPAVKAMTFEPGSKSQIVSLRFGSPPSSTPPASSTPAGAPKR